MRERPILIVHPNDKSTSFLNRIKNHLIQRFGNEIHHFNIYPREDSHLQCLERIKIHSESGLIIFLGHGRTTRLYGSKGDQYDNIDLVSPDAVAESPEKYYNNDNFIHEDNVDVFNGKKIFCLACNSNNKIAKYAIERGATTFFGFGDIPSSAPEFAEDGLKDISKDFVKLIKTEINYIIKKSLEVSLEKGYSFNQLRDILNFITNQRIAYYLRVDKSSKERYTLTDYLYQLKSEMKVFGNGKAKVLGQ